MHQINGIMSWVEGIALNEPLVTTEVDCYI
jgi:hypothetical protein